jgi:RimJ/RimL family protein N-acetyltransferase
LELKKNYEGAAAKTEAGNQFHFAMRLKDADMLVGFVRFHSIFWIHGTAIFTLSFADEDMLRQYGPEALDLVFCYGFRELNLYRLETILPSYRLAAIALFEGAGFLMEARRRQAAYRDGRLWDVLNFGILQSEWKSREAEALAL